jgi:hypothetical protein
MHGVEEAAGGEVSGERKAAWDVKKVMEICLSRTRLNREGCEVLQKS